MPKCAKCHSEIEVIEPVARRDECPSCRTDLHSCIQCILYDRSSPSQCREPIADHVADKESANFCNYFKFLGGAKGNPNATKTKDDMFKKLEGLFKK